ncbi:MAG: aldo/keto reductase [Bauldia sp.]|uniref:aldo/keto reductase n=1 Tax=Bauldia sp. TaxID=2575872 RepID=UPI001DE1738A|nr:aldo/keto reductase [Bauldia sp.]MCB1497716.1 aldo/keto reductase [Bauldia sp.]
MDYRPFGSTGVQVSQLCFGTMSFGGDADEAESGRLYAACRNRGINFFDTADAYSMGRSEEILGRLIAGERDNLIISSKCFNPMSDDINGGGANRRHIATAVEASLKRLGTDRLDILFMHQWDARVPLEETLRALEKLFRDGKVLYLGASNYAAWQVAKGLGISERRGWPRFDVLQPMYNLVKRQAEAEILPLALAEKLAVMPYSPLGGGLLTGKYTSADGDASGSRLVTDPMYKSRYREDWTRDVAGSFANFARERGFHPVSLAVAWVGAHPAITCPIIGARSVEQLVPSLDSVDVDMTPELRREISALSRTPPPATDRLDEQPDEG